MNKYFSLNRNIVNGEITILSVIAAVIMQLRQEYIFYAKEAEHLWLNDWLWIAPQFKEPGGTVQLFTSLITQFYSFWGIGAITLAIVMAYVYMTGWRIQHSLRIKHFTAMLWIIPMGLMFLCNEHTYFNQRFHFSFLVSLLLSYLYIKLGKYCSRNLKFIFSAVLVVLTYWLVGSSAVVTVSVIVLFEIFRTRNWGALIFSVLSYILIAWLSVRLHYFVSMEEAMTPLQYYEWPSTYFFPLYTWLCVPLIILLSKLLSHEVVTKKIRIRHWMKLILYVATIFMLYRFYNVAHNANSYLLRQDEWNARNGYWDELIDSHKGSKQPTAFISYLNLALAEKGQLVERMGEFNPYILWSEETNMYSPILLQNHELSRDALKLQSCVFMRWSGAALANAQKSAFEANLLTPGDTDPIELQRLIVTNRIFSTPKTSEKYLRRLSRTTFYNDLAEQLDSLENVTRLTPLPESDSFYFKTQVGRMLHQIAYQSPENKIVSQFYEAYLIQSRDTTAYRHWKEFTQQ